MMSETIERLTFFDAIGSVLQAEGSYSNDPDDAGKETFWGISSRAHPEILNVKPKHRKELVLKIYHEEYWKPTQVESFSHFWLAWEVFDFSITSGNFKAGYALQRSFNLIKNKKFNYLTEDGEIGPKTLSAINKWYDSGYEEKYHFPLYIGYCTTRARFYMKLNQQKFIRGWLKRCFGRTFRKNFTQPWPLEEREV